MTIDTDTTIEKCREKYKLVGKLEAEEEGHRDKAKAVRKQIDNLESEIRRLVMDGNQTELPLTAAKWQCTNCSEVFDENPGETHRAMVPTGVDGEEPKEYDCGPVLPFVGPPAEEPGTPLEAAAPAEPPGPVRIMKEGEELAPDETWEPTDGNVPREISTPQPRGERVVAGRRVVADDE